MAEFTIRVEGVDQTRLWLKALANKKVRGVYASALKKTADETKSKTAKLITKRYNIKLKDVRKKISVRRHDWDLYSLLSKAKKGIPLIKFGSKKEGMSMKKFKASKKTITGLTRNKKPLGIVEVEIIKGQKKQFPHAFLAKMKSGHVGVFVRKGTFGRQGNPNLEKIKEVHSLDVPTMMGETSISKKIQKFVPKTVQKFFAAAFDRI